MHTRHPIQSHNSPVTAVNTVGQIHRLHLCHKAKPTSDDESRAVPDDGLSPTEGTLERFLYVLFETEVCHTHRS